MYTQHTLTALSLLVLSCVDAFTVSPILQHTARSASSRLRSPAQTALRRDLFAGTREKTIQLGPRRLGATLSALTMTDKASPLDPQTVLVVGGGLGGMSVTFDLKHKLRKQDRVIVLSDRPSFEFTPSNPWVAIRFRKPEDVRVDLSTILPKHGVEFIHGKAASCDPTAGLLTTEDGQDISFDYMVIATGAHLDMEIAPGVRENSVSVCTTDHAVHAADKWDEFLARKDEERAIVVGCLQGASCFGPGYEYVMMLDNELRKHGQRDKVQITMVTSEPYIGHLGLGGVGGSNKELPDLLTERNIDSFPNAMVDEVTDKEVSFTQVTLTGDKKKTIPADFTAFIPPFKGQKIWETVEGLAAPNGMILVDEHMRSVKYTNVFAIGTAVSLPKVENTPVPTGAPKTGYMIESMGTAAALNIRCQMDAREKGKDDHCTGKHVPTLSALCITDFGKTGAAVLALPQFQPRRLELHAVSPLIRVAKIAFEQYFLHKVRSGDCDPYYEKWMLSLVGMERLTDDENTPEFLTELQNKGQDKSPLPQRRQRSTTTVERNTDIQGIV